MGGHRHRVEAELRHEFAGVRENSECHQVGETSQDSGCHECVRDRRGCVRGAECAACAGGDRREDRDADCPADLVPGRVQARDHSRLALSSAGEDRDRDGDHGDSEPEAGDEHPRQHVAEISAVRADVGEESHADRGDREG